MCHWVSEGSEYPFTHYLTEVLGSVSHCLSMCRKGGWLGATQCPFSSETKIRGASFPREERGCEVEVEGKPHVSTVCLCDKHSSEAPSGLVVLGESAVVHHLDAKKKALVEHLRSR